MINQIFGTIGLVCFSAAIFVLMWQIWSLRQSFIALSHMCLSHAWALHKAGIEVVDPTLENVAELIKCDMEEEIKAGGTD